MNQLAFKNSVLRNAILCQVIEPLADKPGCTTRYVDSSPGTKLEYFIVSGVNSGRSFYNLADRIIKQGRQPPKIFDIAYQAQQNSIRNRQGGKVNFGEILLLVPIIAAQTLEFIDTNYATNIDNILDRTESVLKNTTNDDLVYLDLFIDLARKQAQAYAKKIDKENNFVVSENLAGKFDSVWSAAKSNPPNGLAIELAKKYPYTKKAFEIMSANIDEGVIQASEVAYQELLPEVGRADGTADFIVAAMYLIFAKFQTKCLFL